MILKTSSSSSSRSLLVETVGGWWSSLVDSLWVDEEGGSDDDDGGGGGGGFDVGEFERRRSFSEELSPTRLVSERREAVFGDLDRDRGSSGSRDR